MTAVATPPPRPGRVLPTLNEDGSRRWIRPKPSHGKWTRRRIAVAWFLMGIFFVAPFARIAGKPVFLLDLPRREFTILGYTFLPTDTLPFMFFLGTVIISVFLLTALFGRVWCGWACPQTVFLEFLFRPVERFFDGGYTGSRNLDKRGAWFTPRRVAKYGVYGLLALVVSHTVLAFFVGTENLYRWVFNPPSLHPTAFFFVVLATVLLWLNFTWFREQTCLIVCPYGRWQSALIDNQSLIVAYDTTRGEPRSLGVKHRDPAAGDCIDCKACVQTCPTGIDIRNGLQMECVHCTQCMDACDEVMTKVGKPTGLIRYSSRDEIAGKPRHLLRIRTVFYPVVLAAMFGGLVLTLALKSPVDVTLLRGIDAPFREEADGRIANQVRIKIGNRRGTAQEFTIAVEGLETGTAAGSATIIAPESPMTLAAGESRSTSIFIILPRSAFVNGERAVDITVTDAGGYVDRQRYRLLGPAEAPR
jgi:cytochrome c oxidase accessory protein FixG